MAKSKTALSRAKGPVAPPGGFRIGGKTYRTGEPVPQRYARAVEKHQDPAANIPEAAPNFGRDVIPQIITFSGRNATWSNVYRNADEAIRHSLESARSMRNDCSIMECLEARQRATALLNWHLEPENPKSPMQKKLCDKLTKILTKIPRFVEYRRNLLEALWYGRHANQARYGQMIKNGQKIIYVKGWKPINGDKLAFRFNDGRDKFSDDDLGIRVMPGYGVKDALGGDRRIEYTEFGPAYFLEPWERKMIALHKHIIEDGVYEDVLSAGRINGVGIRDRIYWTWYQKQAVLAQMMELVERTGNGITIYWYPYGNPEAKAAVEETAKQQKYTNTLLMPRMPGDPSMDAFGVDQLPVQTGGVQMLKEVLQEHFGHSIKRYILGQILSTEAAATGLGSGVADLHMESFMQIIHYDARNLEETLTLDLVNPLKEYNDPAARDVEIRFVIDTESPESEKKLQAYRQAWEMGLPIKATDIAGIIGASLPTKSDIVLPMNPQITQAQQQAEQAAMMGGDSASAAGDAAAAGGGDPNSPEHLFGPIANLDGDDDGGEVGQGEDVGISGVESEPEAVPEKANKYSKQKTLLLRAAIQKAASETDRNATPAQRKSGNFRKGKVRLHGMDIVIESPKGSRRNPSWPPMPAHYGYISRTLSDADGDHVDVFVGPTPESQLVFVIDQCKEDGKFDEHKCMLGFTNINDARDAYLESYGSDWKIGPITALTVYQFACWLVSGDTWRPICEQVRSLPSAITKRSKTVLRYSLAGQPGEPHRNVGETKVEAGKTYELNEHHRWTLRDGNEAGGNSPVGGTAPVAKQDRYSLDDRKAFAQKQLSGIDSKAAGIFRTFHAAPDFDSSGEYQSKDIHPKVASKLHSWLSENIGQEVGGGVVAELEDGRLGFSSPAGAFTIGQDADGNWQSHYTVLTGPVAEAMDAAGHGEMDAGDDDDFGEETEIETVDPDIDTEGDGDLIETDIPDEEIAGSLNSPTSPLAGNAAGEAGNGDLGDDDAGGAGIPAPPRRPAPHPHAAKAKQLRADADAAKANFDLANQEWEQAAVTNMNTKQSAAHRARVSSLRSIWKDRERDATTLEKSIAKDQAGQQKQRSKAELDAHNRLGTNSLPKKTAKELRDEEIAALSNRGGDKSQRRVPLVPNAPAAGGSTAGGSASGDAAGNKTPATKPVPAKPKLTPEREAARQAKYDEWMKDRPSSKSTAWKRNTATHLADAGFGASEDNRAIIDEAIKRGVLTSQGHVRGAVKAARKLLDNGHEEGEVGALAEAIRNRAKIQSRREGKQSWKATLAEKGDQWDMEPEEYEQVMKEVFGEKRRNHSMIEQAKDHASQAAGLSKKDIDKLENEGFDSGSDHPKIKGLDTLGRELATEYPELGWGAGYEQEGGASDIDYGELLWNLIREGKKPLPAKNSPEFLDEVDEFLNHERNKARGKKRMTPEEIAAMQSTPFQKRRSDFAIRHQYRKWLRNARKYGNNWSEEDHPRGQPENAGEFAPKGGGVSGGSKTAKELAAQARKENWPRTKRKEVVPPELWEEFRREVKQLETQLNPQGINPTKDEQERLRQEENKRKLAAEDHAEKVILPKLRGHLPAKEMTVAEHLLSDRTQRQMDAYADAAISWQSSDPAAMAIKFAVKRLKSAGIEMKQHGKNDSWYGKLPNGDTVRVGDHLGFESHPLELMFDNDSPPTKERAEEMISEAFEEHGI